MTRFLPIAGTHGWRGEPAGNWWQQGSPWLRYLREQGCVPYAPARPFIWTTALDGVPWPWQRARTQHLTWRAAAHNLYAYLVPPIFGGDANGVAATPTATRIVAHSHAAQVVAFACAEGLIVERLITIGSPVREDMADVWRQARPRIGTWVHVHSDASDRWQWLGTLGDGVCGIVRAMPLADRNVAVPGVGHTGLLTDPEAFGWWESLGLIEVLRG